ncbi:SPFH domain-containing protein [Actinomadura sp. 21ATH]|uniref:SPFH domain-containing protein n=1 Tax=Actinomadura sp. 21ATH TaxID=1735444 RepID=UPI0035BF90B5
MQLQLPDSPGARVAALLALAAFLAVLSALAGFRRVPASERLVVLRFGRLLGARGPGLRYLLPFADRGLRVSMRKAPLDIWFRGTTHDGVPVRVKALALLGADDPVRYALTADEPTSAARAVAETALRSVIAERDLADLPRMRSEGDPELLHRVNAAIAPWGITAALVTITEVDAPVQAELLRWAETLKPAP